MTQYDLLEPEAFGLRWNDDYSTCFNHIEKCHVRSHQSYIIFLFKNEEVILHFCDNGKLCSISTYAWRDISDEEMPINDDRLLQWTEQYEKIVDDYVSVIGPPTFSGDPTHKEFFFYHSEARHITVWIQSSIFMITQDMDGWDSRPMIEKISTSRHDDETLIDTDGSKIKSMFT